MRNATTAPPALLRSVSTVARPFLKHALQQSPPSKHLLAESQRSATHRLEPSLACKASKTATGSPENSLASEIFVQTCKVASSGYNATQT